MRRKLVKQGSATMMISLPSKWVKLNKLEKGSEVDLTESEGKIIIDTKSKFSEEVQKEAYNLSNFDPLVNRTLISLYIRGVDEVEVNFSNYEDSKKLKTHVLDELIGFEIVNQTKTSFFIKDITGIDNQDPDILIKRIFFILNSMVEELLNSIDKKEELKSVIEIDASVNKFVNFCLRLLNKKGYKDDRNLNEVYDIVNSFEELGDCYKSIAKYLLNKNKIDKKQIEGIKETKKLINLFEKLFFDFKREYSKELAVTFDDLKKKIKVENVLDLYILQISERIIRMHNSLMIAKFN